MAHKGSSSSVCRSECCDIRFKNTFETVSKLKRTKLVLTRSPVDKTCRVESCVQYGKLVKNLQHHLESEHGMTLSQNHELPPATLQKQYIQTKTSSEWMKYRKPELCFVPGCAHGHEVYLSDLIKHLSKIHKLSREQYRHQLQHLSLKDFHGHCPSMLEEIEESAMEEVAKIMGTIHHPLPMVLDSSEELYPSVRLVHLNVQPDGVGVVSFNEEDVTIQTADNPEGGVISLIGRKRIMSQEHKTSFVRSLQENSPWVFPMDVSWILYQCAICPHTHRLDIVFYRGIDIKH